MKPTRTHTMAPQHRIARSTFVRVSIGLALALGASACASKRNYGDEFRGRLEVAHGDLVAGRLEAARDRATDILGSTAALEKDAGDFRLQRLYAVWILTQAHAVASSGAGFLPAPEEKGLVSAAQVSGTPSRTQSVAHLVATSTFSSYAAAWSRGLESAPSVAGDTQLLPDDLRGLAVVDLAAGMVLCQLAVHTRLGFQSTANGLIQSLPPEWMRYQSLDEQMDRARLPEGLRAWVHYGYFRYLSRRATDHDRAFRFGVRALELAEAAAGTFDTRLVDEIQDWYLGVGPNASAYRFVCPRTDEAPERGLLHGVQDPTSRLIDYLGVKRSD